VPGDQKLADSVHIDSDMRHVCIQLLAADCQARPLSNSCSVAANFGQLLRGLTDPQSRAAPTCWYSTEAGWDCIQLWTSSMHADRRCCGSSITGGVHYRV